MLSLLGKGGGEESLYKWYMTHDQDVLFYNNIKFGKTCFCTYCTPRYQVSIYRNIGPLFCFCFNNNGQTKNSLKLCNVLSHISVSFDVFTFVVVPNITDRVPKYVVNAVYPSPSICPPFTTLNSSLLAYPTEGQPLLYPNRALSSHYPSATLTYSYSYIYSYSYSYPTLSYPTLPYPTLPYPILPNPTLTYPTLH